MWTEWLTVLRQDVLSFCCGIGGDKFTTGRPKERLLAVYLTFPELKNGNAADSDGVIVDLAKIVWRKMMQYFL